MPFTPLTDDDPRQVGGYRLAGRLGAGGMGIVYLARSRAGVPVALKLIRPEYAADPTFRARFAREVETGRRVNGICIARFLDADAEAVQPYLVTEYVEGPGLAEVVAARGPLVGDQLRALAAGLAEGLVSLHRAGVVHRDLKPGNVLLARDAPKIIDFGIAHAADATSMTRTGHVVGSAGWMAPEQASGSPVTTAVDVFAWASVMAYAATGRPPFGEGQPAAVIYRVVHQEPDLAGVPQALLPALTAAFAKEPEARPTPAELLSMVTDGAGADPSGEVTRMLDTAWVPVAPVTTEGESAARRALAGEPGTGDRRVRRRNAVAAAVVVAVLALVTVLVLIGNRDGSEGPPVTTVAPPSSSTSTSSTSTSTSSTSTSTSSTSTSTTTTAPTAEEAWTAQRDALPPSTSATDVIAGSTPLAVSIDGTAVTVWSWRGDRWDPTGSLSLDAPVDGSGAITLEEITFTGPTDLLVALADGRSSVVSLPDGSGRILEFEVPGSSTVRSVDGASLDGRRVSGSVPDLDGQLTWVYDRDVDRFVVDRASGEGEGEGGGEGGGNRPGRGNGAGDGD